MNLGINTSTKNELTICVDWLEFTLKSFRTPYEVLELFGLSLDDFQDGRTGQYGYKMKMVHKVYPITIYYDGNEDMGIHVSVTGSAISYFVNSYKEKRTCVVSPFNEKAYETDSFDMSVLSDLLKDVLDNGHLTRLDIAIDDKGAKYFTLPELSQQFDEGLYTSRFRAYEEVVKRTKKGKTGHTIYLGTRKSAMMIRIYDKKLEQKLKDNEWVRWEIELHKERATAVAQMLVVGKPLCDIALGVLNGYLRLIVRDDSNDSRCSSNEKWVAFLDGVSRVKLCHSKVEKILEEKKDWLKKQVAPTLAAIHKIDGDLSFIYDLLAIGIHRQSAELRHIYENEMRKLGLELNDSI